jgi:hypothetical protein
MQDNTCLKEKLQIIQKYKTWLKISYHTQIYGLQPITGFKIDKCGYMVNGLQSMHRLVKNLFKTLLRI